MRGPVYLAGGMLTPSSTRLHTRGDSLLQDWLYRTGMPQFFGLNDQDASIFMNLIGKLNARIL